MSKVVSVALIGLGEVGSTLAEDLSAVGMQAITAYDIEFSDNKNSAPSLAASSTVTVCDSAANAVKEADLIISAVTAAETLKAAQSVVGSIKAGAFYLDLNSASPGMKQAASDAVNAAGGRYVEAAVMSPIHPKRIGSPLLLGGAYTADFLAAVEGLGFNATPCSDKVGVASATKMCRSVMIKGVEALVAESLLSARYYGVDEAVLGSLSNLLPADNWPELAKYMLSRSIESGTRRAEEVRQVARTVKEAGLEPHMSDAIAKRQDWAATHKDALAEETLKAMLDMILDNNKKGG